MEHSSGGPSADGQGVHLVHDADRERYEVLDGTDVVAVLYYGDEPAPGAGGESSRTVRDLRSTVVSPSRNGEGLGSKLVRRALDDARSQGVTVRATCWFVEGWIQRHPEYADLVEPSEPAQEVQPDPAEEDR